MYKRQIFTKAKWGVVSVWDGGDLTSATAVLTDWKCGDAWHSRGWLSSIVGEKRVAQVEDEFAERWAETAEADARDANGDLYAAE